MCPTQCSRYQRRFAYTSPLNSARCGIPLTPIFGTAGRLTIICRNFVSITADVFRRRTARRIGKTGFTSRVRKWRTRWTPCLIARANGCGAGVSAEGELERVVNAALNRFFQDTHRWISDAFAADVRVGIDALLVVPESAAVSGFEGLKADPGNELQRNPRLTLTCPASGFYGPPNRAELTDYFVSISPMNWRISRRTSSTCFCPLIALPVISANRAPGISRASTCPYSKGC